MRRVVVTGMGIVSSIGYSLQEVTASLHNASSGTVASREMTQRGFRSQVEGRPTMFSVEDYITRKAMRFHGGGTAWNHVALQQAIDDACLPSDEVSNELTGIIMGSGGPSTKTIVEAAASVLEEGGTKRIGPFAVPKAMSSTASATLATPFKIKGVNYSITSACATSAHCIRAGAMEIRSGGQDIVFAGGCEDLDWTLSCLFDAMGAMSSNFNDTPAVASRAYDKDRDGFVIAGGAGVLVLEELEHAKARRAKIYAELVGWGATSDGHDMVAPSGEGAIRCMQQAIASMHSSRTVAGTFDDKDPSIDYINTHGTSTPVGDRKEIEAIRQVFGKHIPHISSTKSLTGHSLGASGVQEAIYSLLMMKDNFLCESAHIKELDPEFADIPIIRKRIDNAKVDTIMSNSFGFGGTNATLIFERYMH